MRHAVLPWRYSRPLFYRSSQWARAIRRKPDLQNTLKPEASLHDVIQTCPNILAQLCRSSVNPLAELLLMYCCCSQRRGGKQEAKCPDCTEIDGLFETECHQACFCFSQTAAVYPATRPTVWIYWGRGRQRRRWTSVETFQMFFTAKSELAKGKGATTKTDWKPLKSLKVAAEYM